MNSKETDFRLMWYYKKQLLIFEGRLREHFETLSKDRNEGQVFLIEHGLLPFEIAELMRAVGTRGSELGFRSEVWQSYRLSLGVILSEFGYLYRGTGTEFWGFAERSLGAEICLSERPEISKVFEQLSMDYAIATPLNDRWSEAFGHIAWPIRNALVSREIHSPLASLIRRTLRDKSSFMLNTGFVSILREVAAGLSSKRLEAWLSDEILALSVVRALVDDSVEGLEIEQTFMQRLDEDLRGNREVRRLTLAARAARQAHDQAPKKLPRPLYQLLMQKNEPVGLAIRGPSLGAGELALVEALTEGESSDAILSVAGRSIPFREFIAGGMIFLGRPRELPVPDVDGITDISETIESLVSPSDKLLFIDVESDGYQPQILSGSRLPADAAFFELRLADADPEDWGSALYGLRVNSSEGAAKLSANGITNAQKNIIEFFGGATLVQSEEELSQVEGHDVWIKAQVGSVDMEVRSSNGGILSTHALPQSKWVQVETAGAPCSLHVTDGHSKQVAKLAFRAVNSIEPLRIEVSPSQLTLNDVGAGLGSVDVRAPSRLDGATVLVSLTDAQGNYAQSEICVESLPAAIGFSLDAMNPIREAAQRWSCSGKTATIKVKVEGLASITRPLPARHLDWIFDETKRTWDSDDGRSVQSVVFHASGNPVLPIKENGNYEFAAELLLPDIEVDQRLNLGRFFVNSKQIHLTEIGAVTSLRIRKNTNSVEGADGLIAASEALVAWQSATATSLVSDGIMKRVGASIEDGIVEAICGRDWLSAEKKLDLVNCGFHESLVRYALERKLAVGSDNFDEISEIQMRELAKLLLVEFRKALPAASVLVFPEGEEWPALDDAVNSAWSKLASQLKEANGTIVDGDCIVLNGEWQKAVSDAQKADLMRPLARKILPITRSIGLLQLSYLEAGFDELISELNSRHVDVQRTGRHISPEALRALLSLFLRPSQVVENPNWRSLLARFASDRFSARAVRYAAIRYRAIH